MRSKKIFLGILLTLFISIICLIIFPNTVNGAVSYTKSVTGNDGSITLNLTGLNLDTSKPYSFALVTRGEKPTTWHKITEYTKNTAKIELRSSTKDILNVLKVTDTGIIYVREGETDTYVVNALEVNLKLPYMNAINVSDDNDYIRVRQIYGYKGTSYYLLQEIKDEDQIRKYLEYKNNGTPLKETDFTQTAPTTGFSTNWRHRYPSDDDYLAKSDIKSKGLYYLWVKYTNEDCKDILGYYIYDASPKATKLEEYIDNVDLIGPTVKSIQIVSPASGTYKTPQTVKLNVYFSEKIKGTTIPTLKIKFGYSSDRNLTSGTIKNTEYTTPCIEYTYNIQNSDIGQLQAISLSGGNITDESGNSAKLTCPVLTGSITIKANTEGTTTNQTNNQDKNNTQTADKNNQKPTTTNNNNEEKKEDNKTNNTGTNNNPVANNNQSTTQDTTTNKGKDTTVYNAKKLPQTGASNVVIACIAIASIIGIILYFKYRKIKDII